MALLYFIVLAIIVALFWGDCSLLVAVLKFLGGASLVIGMLYMLACCPLLLFIIIGVLILILWAYYKK